MYASLFRANFQVEKLLKIFYDILNGLMIITIRILINLII
jgi:hypothetical protein